MWNSVRHLNVLNELGQDTCDHGRCFLGRIQDHKKRCWEKKGDLCLGWQYGEMFAWHVGDAAVTIRFPIWCWRHGEHHLVGCPFHLQNPDRDFWAQSFTRGLAIPQRAEVLLPVAVCCGTWIQSLTGHFASSCLLQTANCWGHLWRAPQPRFPLTLLPLSLSCHHEWHLWRMWQ